MTQAMHQLEVSRGVAGAAAGAGAAEAGLLGVGEVEGAKTEEVLYLAYHHCSLLLNAAASLPKIKSFAFGNDCQSSPVTSRPPSSCDTHAQRRKSTSLSAAAHTALSIGSWRPVIEH